MDVLIKEIAWILIRAIWILFQYSASEIEILIFQSTIYSNIKNSSTRTTQIIVFHLSIFRHHDRIDDTSNINETKFLDSKEEEEEKKALRNGREDRIV